MLLKDFAIIPGLLDDFGHYLFLQETDIFWKDKANPAWRKNITNSKSNLLSFVEIPDIETGIYSVAEQLVKEDAKFRIFLCPNRVSQHCPVVVREENEAFCSRIILSTIQKYRLKDFIHTDYLWIGNVRYYGGTKQQRGADLRMIHKVKAILSGTTFLQCDERFLSINPKADYTSFFNLPPDIQKNKIKLAEELNDIGLIWQCGLSRRKKIREQQVFSYKDPEFIELFPRYVPTSKFKIVENMMRLNESLDQDLDFPPASHPIWQNDLFTIDFDKLLFVDFETDFQKCIYMFGYSNLNTGYNVEWAEDLCPTKELSLMHRIYNLINQHHREGGRTVFYFAEDRFWRERCRHHKLYDYIDLFSSGVDLYQVFEKGPFLVKGAFNFKLKTIAKRLFEMSKIPIFQPDGCSDGNESVAIAKRWFLFKKEEDRDVLEKYNQFDCDVLLEISRFLRAY